MSFGRALLNVFECLFAIQSGLSGSRGRFPILPDGDTVEGKGRLSVRGGWRFLHLEGTPAERGRQHGRLLGPLIRTLSEEYLRGIRFWRRLKRIDLLSRARLFERFIPETVREEMIALGEAAGMSYDETLVTHTFLESCQLAQCSCFAAWGGSTRDGGLVFGRNLDFMSMGFAQRAGLITFVKPEQGIPFISIGWPGWCGALTAVNLAGLCVGPLSVPRLGLTKGGMPYVILYREIALNAVTCEDALRFLAGSARTFPTNVLLAQSAPRPSAVVAEYTAKDLVHRVPRDGQEFILSTNHFRKLGRPSELTGSGGVRYNTMRDLLKENPGRVTPRTPILSDPRVCLCNNLHSLVAAPGQRLLRIAMGRRPAALGAYRTFTYDENGIHLPRLVASH